VAVDEQLHITPEAAGIPFVILAMHCGNHLSSHLGRRAIFVTVTAKGMKIPDVSALG
jgi:hypothetical protein